jgi:hypothetical protein
VSDYNLLSSTSWGNYESVDLAVGTRYLMHCGDMSGLVNDTSYGIKDFEVVIGSDLIYAGAFVVGSYYTIYSIGTTSFTDIGSSENSVGVLFKATDPGTGSGIAKLIPMVPVTASNFIVGQVYTIETIGSTDFMAIGAINNVIGTQFTAKGPGSGTGTAMTIAPPITLMPSEVNLLISSDPYSFNDKELNAYVPGSSFNSTMTLKYSSDQLNGVYELTAPQSSFAQLVSPIIPSNPINPSLFGAQPVTGAAIVATTVKHKYILGPV